MSMALRPRSDLTRWRLDCVQGAHFWRYADPDAAASQAQTRAEKHFLGIAADDPQLNAPESYRDTARNGWSFYQSLQMPDGHWACGYGGPSFLLPGLIFAMYITGSSFPEEMRLEIPHYLAYHVNEDGGWGLHLEGPSTVLATTLYYVMLRMLGLRPDDELVAGARKCLQSLGGPTGIPQWGKIWLSCLNLFDWNGVNPIPPEFWLLPEWLPFHPSRWWVQCRVVYLPTSYLYSKRLQMPLNPLLRSIREEIYSTTYESIDFSQYRNFVAASDLKMPHSRLLRAANSVLRLWERYLRPNWLLESSQRFVLRLISREDQNTGYNCLAPVNKAFHMVTVFASEGPSSEQLALHKRQLPTYFWIGSDGLTCSGTNGIQAWDTAFSIQAAAEAGLHRNKDVAKSLDQALFFMQETQLDSNLEDPYRQPRKGGWPFSTKDNGYVVSDCAAEGLSAVITLQEKCDFAKKISHASLCDCVDTILGLQNDNGGFASYERVRGSPLLELLNPAEIFDQIMIEHAHVECTSACLTALAAFQHIDSSYRTKDVKSAILGCIRFIHGQQRKDGSWYGFWGVCFTYATFLALRGLAAAGHIYATSPQVRHACTFLLDKQREDGGWGEHYTSCELEEYVQHTSQVVNTSWSLLGLMFACYPDKAPIERGLKLIKARQQANGSWAQESIEGVFNKTCMIGYPNHKHIFTVWALGKYSESYLPSLDNSVKLPGATKA